MYGYFYSVYVCVLMLIVVVVLCASPDTVREIMIAADAMNFDNGEYVFFNIDLFARSHTHTHTHTHLIHHIDGIGPHRVRALGA